MYMTKSRGGQGIKSAALCLQGHDNSAQLCVLLCETMVGAPGFYTTYPLVMTNMAMENDHRNSGFSH